MSVSDRWHQAGAGLLHGPHPSCIKTWAHGATLASGSPLCEILEIHSTVRWAQFQLSQACHVRQIAALPLHPGPMLSISTRWGYVKKSVALHKLRSIHPAKATGVPVPRIQG